MDSTERSGHRVASEEATGGNRKNHTIIVMWEEKLCGFMFLNTKGAPVGTNKIKKLTI